MSGRRGLLFIFLFVILSLFVSAETRIYCNASSNPFYLSPTTTEPDTLQDCVVETDQILEVPDGTTYYVDMLTIEEGYILQFYSSTQTSGQRCIYGGSGGVRYVSGGVTCRDTGKNGASGGGGGCLFKKGFAGSDQSDSECSSVDGGAAGKVGGRITLDVVTLEVNGVLSVNGTSGTKGDNGGKRKITGCDGACGGAGGGAGGSGGKLTIIAYLVTGSGIINAEGGNGGDGGNGYLKTSGTLCCKQYGGGGGGGVGGAGGQILISAPEENMLLSDLRTSAGEPGSGGSGHQSGGTPNPSPDGEYNPEDLVEDCNNQQDDNNDNLIDMEDPDCRDRCMNEGGQPQENFIFEIYDEVDKSALNGSDGCCGDDIPFCQGTLPADCSGFQPPCPADIECTVAYGGGVCEGPITNTDCSQFSDQSSCQELAPYCSWQYVVDLYSDPKDYAFFDSDNQYFCSNDYDGGEISLDPADWHWWDAEINSFIIHNIDSESKSFDVISNRAQWFVCDASGNAPSPLGGLSSDNYIPQYSTFPSKYDDGEVNCTETMNDWFGDSLPDGIESFVKCDHVSGVSTYCCDPPIMLPLADIGENCNCYLDDDSTPINICEDYPEFCPQPEPTGTSGDDVLKSFCGVTLDCLGASEGFNGADTCSNQGGELVNQAEGEVCSNGILIYSTEQGQSEAQRQCCYGENAEVITFDINDPRTCADWGGVVCFDENDVCTGYQPPDSNCCFGGVCRTLVSFDDVILNESFICSQEHGSGYFVECCYPGKCKNKYSGSLKRFYVGRGNALHQVDVYDTYVSGSWNDYVRIMRTDIDDDLEFGGFKIKDWRDFDTLEFDFAYNVENLPTHLSFSDGSNTFLVAEHIRDLSINSFGPKRWHHIIVDLTSISDDLSSIEEIIIGVNEFVLGWLRQAGERAEYSVDNIILRDLDDTSSNNSEIRYCAGGFGKWIADLDPISGVDMSDVSSYGPYKFSCESQAAFDWTGSRCCGDDTRFNYGEFFNDSYHGCFNGTTVYTGWTLANSTNDYSNNNKMMLFYDGAFQVCTDGAYTYFSSFNFSYDGDTQEDSLITLDNKVTLFESKGSWYCDPEGWKYLKDANKMRIIAATLKQIGSQEGDYSLHCGDANTIMNANVTDLQDAVNIKDFCVLQTDESVLIGAPVDAANVNTFLREDLQYFHPFRDEGDYTCDFAPDVIFNKTQFYQQCDNVGDWLNASYNKPFGILLFNLKDTGSGGVFGFLKDWWEAIVEFFKTLFRGEQSSGDYISIPEDYEKAAFEELYIKQVSDKKIYSVREQDTIVVVYENFDTDMTFLKELTELWFEKNSDEFDITFNVNGTTQTLAINGTIVNDFNWNYLTSNLKFD
ncbi:MAG: hypothetical protein ISS25_04670 [Nanoarchaeota archaeon]|nr:hypothetical protein [DPANN group archaeon]MBL7117094.1 hypothetical protein [Nanoarchaeota archaeon]